MCTSSNPGIARPPAQRGFVLVVALILLLVLTVLGLAASQHTSLEERMAGNERNQNLAFQAAEAGLRAGEFCVATRMPTCTAAYSNATTGGNGAYQFDPVNVTLWTQPGFWTTAGNTLKYRTIAQQDFPNVAAAPEFIVESLPVVSAPGCNIGTSHSYGSSAAAGVQRWRITARGTGGDKSSTVMVQEIYQTCGS